MAHGTDDSLASMSLTEAADELAAAKTREEAYADLLAIATGIRAGWLSDLTVPELVQKWEAMSELIDFVDHGTAPASWLAYKKHRSRAASEPRAEEGTHE